MGTQKIQIFNIAIFKFWCHLWLLGKGKLLNTISIYLILTPFCILLLFSIRSLAFQEEASLGVTMSLSDDFRKENTYYHHIHNQQNIELEPLATLNWKQWLLTDKGLQFHFIKSYPFSLFLLSNYVGEAYKNSELQERKKTLMAGGGLRFYPLSIYYLNDILGIHGSWLARAQLQIPYEKGAWFFLPTIGMSSYSRGWSQYYFGISSGEASHSSFSEYSLRKGQDLFINFRSFFQLYPTWKLYGLIEKRTWLSDISKSPTVIRASYWKISFGATYQFF